MLAAVLLVLKIIGIILLVLLGILLLVTLVVLFVPAFYRIDFRNTAQNDMYLCVKFNWLFHIVRGSFCMENQNAAMHLRVFWLDLLNKKEKEEKKDMGRRRKKKQKKKRHNKADSQKKSEKIEVLLRERETAALPEKKEAVVATEKKVSQEKSRREKRDKQEEKGKTKTGHLSIGEKIKHFFEALKECVDVIKQKCNDINNTINTIRSSKDRILTFIQDESNKKGLSVIKDFLLSTWRHARPRNRKGWIRFGTGDPCSTGQALGVLSWVYSWIAPIRVVPDFEEKVLEADVRVKGRMHVYALGWYMVRLFMNDDFEKFRKNIGKVKEKV